MNELKRKTAIKIVALLVMISIVISGCGKTEIAVRIHSDGSADFKLTESINVSKIEKEFKKIGATKEDIDKLWEGYRNQGYVLSDDGKNYVRSKEYSIKKGELSYQFSGFDEDAYACGSVVYFKLNVKKIPEAAELINEAKETGIKFSDDDFKVVFSFEFDEPVVNTTGTVDKSNPCHVTFSTNLGKTITVFASTDKSIKLKSFEKPGKVKVSKFKKHLKKNKKTGNVEVKLKEQKYTTKYQVQYADNKKFDNCKKISTNTQHFYINKLKKNKTYYVRIRAVRKLFNKKVVYGPWVKKTIKMN